MKSTIIPGRFLSFICLSIFSSQEFIDFGSNVAADLRHYYSGSRQSFIQCQTQGVVKELGIDNEEALFLTYLTT